MMIRALLSGIATYVPGVHSLVSRGKGGSYSARYCYSVWLRHLILAYKNGLAQDIRVVAELGPGDSLGVGLAALLSGADTYYAFDIVKRADVRRNIEMLAELVALFRRKESVPGGAEFPKLKPYLDSYGFPSYILTDKILSTTLADDRVERLRSSIIDADSHGSSVRYAAPWCDLNTIEQESVDMICSQAVLEHVCSLQTAYEAMHSWLKPAGFMSHTIDFKSHGTAGRWNGHWTYSDWMWTLMKGKRPYLLNREPHSAHIQLLNESGFEIVCDLTFETACEIERSDLAPKFRTISESDLIISEAFIQARKRL